MARFRQSAPTFLEIEGPIAIAATSMSDPGQSTASVKRLTIIRTHHDPIEGLQGPAG